MCQCMQLVKLVYNFNMVKTHTTDQAPASSFSLVVQRQRWD